MKDELRFRVEVREDEGRLGPGRLCGVVMRYGERAADRPELFEAGSLTWPDDGVVVNRQHTRTAPILRALPLVVGNEVHIDSEIPDTSAGRDCASEIRGGLFKNLSVEFKATAQTIVGGVRRISKAVLSGVAVVDAGAYAGSTVEVRGKEDTSRPTARFLWL